MLSFMTTGYVRPLLYMSLQVLTSYTVKRGTNICMTSEFVTETSMTDFDPSVVQSNTLVAPSISVPYWIRTVAAQLGHSPFSLLGT